MSARTADGSAGDADYGVLGPGYRQHRRADPAIAARILEALGDARTVLNVGAGAGSYEPRDREVVAVEPSATMRAQRPADLPEAIDATAEALPFADGTFEAAMATFSVHQWHDLRAGLAELRRVTRGPVVVMTADPERVQRFWLDEYAPAVLATEARRYPRPATLARALGARTRIEPLPIPRDCTDGFCEAYYGRPEAFLQPGVRAAQSAWSFLPVDVALRSVRALRRSLEDGTWDARWGALRTSPEYDGSLVLVRSAP